MQRAFRLIDVAELMPMNLAPSEKLIQSIGRYGLLTPVILAEVADDDGVVSLDIIDGNRRVAAAKRVGLEKIPAVVYQQADREAMAAVTVIANTQRSRNPLSESRAVEELVRLGYHQGQIMDATGLTRSSLDSRMRPSTMPSVLRAAIDQGKIQPHVWERAAKLPPDSQSRLARLVEQGRAVRSADIDAERKRVDAMKVDKDPGPVPEVGSGPTSHARLVEQLTVLATYVRSTGKGEYEWGKLTAEAWRRSGRE